MAEDTSTPFPSERGGGADRGSRSPGNREAGGFRIRLSDNEMQAARALQEAFGLRSTVAVLGFALRTLAQQLEQGQLDALVAQHRAQAGSREPGPRGDDRRRESSEGMRVVGGGGGGRAQRIYPFARPSRPGPSPAASHTPAAETPAAETPTDETPTVETDTASDLASEAEPAPETGGGVHDAPPQDTAADIPQGEISAEGGSPASPVAQAEEAGDVPQIDPA